MTFKYLSIALILIQGCLGTGCMLQPVPADKLFGTYKPAFKVRRTPNEFLVEADSNAKGKLKIKRFDPATGHLIEEYDSTLNIAPDETLDAQGRVISAMHPTRMGEFGAIAHISDNQLEAFRMGMDFAGKVKPQPVPTPVEETP